MYMKRFMYAGDEDSGCRFWYVSNWLNREKMEAGC